MSEKSYIVIEGVIGVGKTSLTRLLAEHLDARMIIEQHEENPFLKDFYLDPERYAFQTELFFLLSRYRQQTEHFAQPDLFQKYLVSDYHFSKNRIFAHITLDDREFKLYEHVYSLLERDITTPDLVVYLQSNPQRLMKNIQLRDRSYERDMNPRYIESLVEAYNHFFFHYDASPLLVVNATKIDFVNNGGQLKDLINRIMDAPAGTTYYNPGGGDL